MRLWQNRDMRGWSYLLVASVMGCGFDAPSTPAGDGPPPIDAVDAPPDVAEAMPDAAGCSVVELAAAGFHTCGRTLAGDVHCWGRANNGELGIADLAYKCTFNSQMFFCSPSPVRVALDPATALGAGNLHTCAATTAGAYCWGDNQYGAYGAATTPARSIVPVRVPTRDGTTSIAAGISHTCSITPTGLAACSGRNFAGEVGNGATVPQPNATPSAQPATAVAAGDYTSCVLDGTNVVCWGQNTKQQIDSSGVNRLSPVAVVSAKPAAQVSVGREHLCTLFTDGTAECRGSNFYGQLGNGMTSMTPQVATVMVADLAEISAEHEHTCMRTSAGAVSCVGEEYGPTAVAIALPVPAVALASGAFHDCAIARDGNAYCWGRADFGQLGNGINAPMRTNEPALVRICP